VGAAPCLPPVPRHLLQQVLKDLSREDRTSAEVSTHPVRPAEWGVVGLSVFNIQVRPKPTSTGFCRALDLWLPLGTVGRVQFNPRTLGNEPVVQ